MKILSDTFKIEATYDELLFMYEGMMKILDEMIEEREKLLEKNKGIPYNKECLFMIKDKQCHDLSIILGKNEEFLMKRGIKQGTTNKL